MKVILLQDVENLGDEGDIVTVKAGYGRNYLIPQGWARIATAGAVKARREEMRQQVRKRAQQRDNADLLKKEIEKVEVVIEAKVGEENRIFGTVTPQQVALKLATQGFSIDRRHIKLNEDIRLIGVYTATVKLHAEVEAQLKLRVVPEGGEAPAEVPETAEAPPAADTAEAAEAASAAEAAEVTEAAPAAEAEATTEVAEAEPVAETDTEPKEG